MPLENSRGRPVEFTGRPVKSTGSPLEFSRGRPLEQKIWPNRSMNRADFFNPHLVCKSYGIYLLQQRGGTFTIFKLKITLKTIL